MTASQPDREDNTPFLLRLFYRQGSFHRPDEFASRTLPQSLDLHTWPTCTLNELACLIASERPALLPSPSIGTRLAFRLIYPDARSVSASSQGPPRFVIKELGSVVIGEGGPGASNGALDGGEQPDADEDVDMGVDPPPKGRQADAGESTLEDARYVIGDYVSCAILAPLPDGSVAPEAYARPNTATAGFPGSRRDSAFGRGEGWNRRRQFGDVPMGDWRRGERLPDDPPDRSWGGGRGARRGR